MNRFECISITHMPTQNLSCLPPPNPNQPTLRDWLATPQANNIVIAWRVGNLPRQVPSPPYPISPNDPRTPRGKTSAPQFLLSPVFNPAPAPPSNPAPVPQNRRVSSRPMWWRMALSGLVNPTSLGLAALVGSSWLVTGLMAPYMLLNHLPWNNSARA